MQVHLFISGFVQGVGYRNFVKKEARKRKLVGWVKNLVDGRVEAVVYGPKEKIEELIPLCKKGPFLAEVESVDAVWEENLHPFTSFDVVREKL